MSQQRREQKLPCHQEEERCERFPSVRSFHSLFFPALFCAEVGGCRPFFIGVVSNVRSTLLVPLFCRLFVWSFLYSFSKFAVYLFRVFVLRRPFLLVTFHSSRSLHSLFKAVGNSARISRFLKKYGYVLRKIYLVKSYHILMAPSMWCVTRLPKTQFIKISSYLSQG